MLVRLVRFVRLGKVGAGLRCGRTMKLLFVQPSRGRGAVAVARGVGLAGHGVAHGVGRRLRFSPTVAICVCPSQRRPFLACLPWWFP